MLGVPGLDAWRTKPLQHGVRTGDRRRGRQAAEAQRECLVEETHAHSEPSQATLARLDIHDFRPTLREAAQRLAALHIQEGMALPPNALAELQRIWRG
jgi:hypothetical protein